MTDICSAGSTIKPHCYHCTCQVDMLKPSLFSSLIALSTLLSWGYLLVCQHNPPIDWALGKLGSGARPVNLPVCSPQPQNPLRSSPEFPDLSTEVCLDLKEVFSKILTTSLPRQRPYDCNINLLARTAPPKGRLYSLSSSERRAMDEYTLPPP